MASLRDPTSVERLQTGEAPVIESPTRSCLPFSCFTRSLSGHEIPNSPAKGRHRAATAAAAPSQIQAETSPKPLQAPPTSIVVLDPTVYDVDVDEASTDAFLACMGIQKAPMAGTNASANGSSRITTTLTVDGHTTVPLAASEVNDESSNGGNKLRRTRNFSAVSEEDIGISIENAP